MKWYYAIRAGHTHVRVFYKGAKCGDLCFRNEEFERLQAIASYARYTPEPFVTFEQEPEWNGENQPALKEP